MRKQWEDIKTFCEKAKITMKEVYYRINQRQWYDGFVIKKTPTGRIKFGCIDDYEKWTGISK